MSTSVPSLVPSADDLASTATATRSHAASTPTPEAFASKDTAVPKAAKAAPVRAASEWAASKWALRPRKLTRGRLQAQGLAPKRKHDEIMPNTPDLETASWQSNKTAVASLKKSSEVLEAEARSEKYFSLQHTRCMQLVSKAPWRRYWRKMSIHEAFLRREARIRETLQKRESDLRDLWQKEVSKMRTELDELQSQQAEGVKKLQGVQANRQAITTERRQEEKKYDSAFAELQQKIQALGGPETTTKAPAKDAAKDAPKRNAAQKAAQRRPRNRGWSHKPKPRKAAQAAPASQAADEPAEAPPSPKGPAPAKKPPASPRGTASTKKTGAMLEASPAAKTAKKTAAMMEASPPPARLPAQNGAPDSSPMSSPRSVMASPQQGGSPQGGSPQGGSPLARSPPRSPSVPKCSAPFVEFVGAPVGKGSKVPGSMWPWPSEMMTRSRAKAL